MMKLIKLKNINDKKRKLLEKSFLFLSVFFLVFICGKEALSQTVTTFTDVTGIALVNNSERGMGAAWEDYNNDGFMDLYVVNYKETNRRYHNNGNDNHWIIIKTIGTTNNRAGIGARIEITTDSGSQIREVDGGSDFCSQDSLWVHFGLGGDDSITTLKITWPNGKTRGVHSRFFVKKLIIYAGWVTRQKTEDRSPRKTLISDLYILFLSY